jgi:molecular chaperone IbpA
MKGNTVTYNTVDKMWDDLMMIGFGKNINNLQSFPKHNSGFPFYNVIKVDENTFGIEVAVAGFSEENIEISEHNSSLTIVGRIDDTEEKNYLHRGITTKSFSRTFALAEHVHVASARMKNGMLQIVLKRDVPEEAKPKRIAIEA